MTSGGTGLSDNRRTVMGIVIYSLIALSAYVATQPGLEMLIVPFAIAAIVAGIAKDQLGIRDATSSAIARAVNTESTNVRDTSDSIK